MAERFRITVKPFALLDLLDFKNIVPGRKKRFQKASSACPPAIAPMNALAAQLHPVRQYLRVSKSEQIAPGVKRFELVPDEEKGMKQLAYFRAGQYLSIKVNVGGVPVTRPYSLSSSPTESLRGVYQITVKRQENGFVTDYIFDHWSNGTEVEASGPEGQFYYERLRDCAHIAGIAGGSGITPFVSMARQFKKEDFPVAFTLFYGCNCKNDILFKEELDALAQSSGGRFQAVYVLCKEKDDCAEEGFVSAELIKKYVDPKMCSFFICGPQAMYEFVAAELARFDLPQKQVRREVFGEIKNVSHRADYPKNVPDSFALSVTMRGKTIDIPALREESLLVALERAGLKPPSKCRSGVCSFCRSELVSGDVYIPEDTDGRRAADKTHGFIHPCSSYPLSDIKLIVPSDEV